ncbi:MAG: hypothetical protein ABIP65_08140 [Vicinamibacterales bacterium]
MGDARLQIDETLTGRHASVASDVVVNERSGVGGGWQPAWKPSR